MLRVATLALLLPAVDAVCGDATPWTAGTPALQYFRPPLQTANHLQVYEKNVGVNGSLAANNSAAATDWLRNYVVGLRPKLVGLPCANATEDELLEIVRWEYQHIAIIHNGPLFQECIHTLGCDDTRLLTNLNNGYIQNVVQRYVMGCEGYGAITYECGLMQKYLGFPAPKVAVQPTLREANDNSLYLANNMMKVASGNAPAGFGDATYVLNTNRIRDKVLVAPFDSGAFFNANWVKYGSAIGTLDAFDHVLKEHFQCGAAGACGTLKPPYDLAALMQRWYGNGPLSRDIYTEMELVANAYLPDMLSYVNAYAPTLWGTETGRKLALWSQQNNRPLIWGAGDDSGMLIDPSVGQVNGSYITPAMAQTWRALSSQPYTPALWSTLYAQAAPALKFHLPDYYVSRPLCAALEARGHTVLGRNEAGDCVYLNDDPVGGAYECLNDGQCARTSSTYRMNTFSDMSTCETHCNSGWRCQQNEVIGSGMAGAHALMCVPDAYSGQCNSLEQCEADCVPPPGVGRDLRRGFVHPGAHRHE